MFIISLKIYMLKWNFTQKSLKLAANEELDINFNHQDHFPQVVLKLKLSILSWLTKFLEMNVM